MFSEVEMAGDVVICAKLLKGQSPSHQHILTRLLQHLIYVKACREHGFYLGVTAIKSIGKDKYQDEYHRQARVLTVPVSFTCRTFLPAPGGILQGTVSKVFSNGGSRGVMIKSGPLRYAYLSCSKMPDYRFVRPKSEDEKPYFQKDDLTKIGVGVIVRFVVLSVRFKEGPHKRRNDVHVLATMEGDDATLGPVSLTGSDRPYM